MTNVGNIDDTRADEPFGKRITMIAFVSVLLKEEQARAAEPGLCFTEQYNAQVCLGVVPEVFLLADHANT